MKTTPLHEAHLALNAKMIDFYAWHMPLHYGSQLAEHHAVRQSAGMFDVSHMTVIDITGNRSVDFLRWLLPSDVGRLKKSGRALYSALLNDEGGIIDDLILYRLPTDDYRLITNCGTREPVLAWLGQTHQAWCKQHNTEDIVIKEQPDLAILAVQGPEALAKCQACLPEYRQQISDLPPFSGIAVGDAWAARTGYTGESGLEIILPAQQALRLWQSLIEQQVQPIGLGARDTLRLEAGLNLYGQDMDEQVTPLSANMRKIVHWKPRERDFIGKDALIEQKEAGGESILTGLVLQTPGVPRQGYLVHSGERQCGVVTSGAMSPSLKQGIALVRVAADTPNEVSLEIRGKKKSARLVPLPFYRAHQS